MSSDAQFVKVFKSVIKRTADAEEIKPYEVTRRMVRKHFPNEISDRQIGNMGGFSYLREMFFPAPKGPLDIEGIESWSKQALVDYLVTLIEQASEYAGVAPHECTWDEFARFVHWRWGQNEKCIPRYIITRAGGFNRIRDARFKIEPTETVVTKRRLQIDSSLNRKEAVEKADKQYIFEQLDTWADRFRGVFKDYSPPRVVSSKQSKRILNVIISDDHFGSDLDPEEVGICYGRIEESRRFASILKQILAYVEKPSVLHINVWVIGDLFQGNLHDARDGAPLAEQMCRTIHLLCQFLVVLSATFGSVKVFFAVGNHGRNKDRHKQRAVHSKWDGLDTPVYYAVKSACGALKNLSFLLPKTPYVIGEIFGQQVFATHGDTVIKAGMPSQSIDVKGIEHQITKWGKSDPKGFSAFISGHVHTGSFVMSGSGVPFITNMALVPPDPYAFSIGAPESQCGQILFESRPDNIVFSIVPMLVGAKDDHDETLDELIQPWSGF